METLACLSTNNCYQSDAVKRSLLLPAAVDMGFRAILEILKTDDFEEFKEEMGLKASILKGMVQSTIIEMGYINFSYRGTRQLIYFFLFPSNRQTTCSGYRVAQSASCFPNYKHACRNKTNQYKTYGTSYENDRKVTSSNSLVAKKAGRFQPLRRSLLPPPRRCICRQGMTKHRRHYMHLPTKI